VDYRTDCGEMLYCLLVKLGMLARVDTILHLHAISQLAAVTGNWYGAPIELKHYPYELYQGHPATRSAFAIHKTCYDPTNKSESPGQQGDPAGLIKK
jgi:hypothetical protein